MFVDKSEGEVSNFSFANFFSHSAEKKRRGTIRESLISGIEKIYASESYVTIFRRNCLPHKPKHFVEEAFYAVFPKMSESEKVFGEEGGESINNFLRKIFVAHCRKMPKGNSLVFH